MNITTDIVKDDNGLNDFQKVPALDGIGIPKVGINRFRIPLNYMHRDGGIFNHDTEASMFINMPPGKTGINMSRLCSILQDEGGKNPVNKKFFKTIVNRFRYELRDFDTEEPFTHANLKLEFLYPVKQKSLKSDNWGWQYYKTIIEANENDFYITLEYEYSSTCPCSLSMARQYEAEYKNGETTEGNGIATAHSQRSRATAKIRVDIESAFYVEDLVDILRLSIPTETQSLVKRIDEQAFAILNGENPMFVEHASKRVSKVFNGVCEVKDWIVKFEHFESLHSHNAVAVISKGLTYGFKADRDI